MNTLQKRQLLFLLGCIPARLLIAYLAYSRPDLLPILAKFALVVSAAWIFIWAFDLRKTGVEVFGGKIWWNNLRPVHALLWLWFASKAVSSDKKAAYKILLLDALVGLTAFVGHHFG